MVLANTVGWILTLIVTGTGDYSLNNDIFLGPDTIALDNWGAKNPWKMQQDYQVWRFITPLFLSNGFSQYFISIFLLMLVGGVVN